MIDWLRRTANAVSKTNAVPVVDIARLLASADALREAGDRKRASDGYLQAHEAAPERIHPLYWLATLSEESGDLVAAQEFCARALALDPDQIGLLLRFASICVAAGDDVTALQYYQRIAALDGEVPGIDTHLADQYCRLGRLREGLAAFDRALARTPDDATIQSNRLFVLNFSDIMTPPQLFDEHRAWGVRHEAVLNGQQLALTAVRATGARLRVGYVSSDLRDHAVASFVEPLLCAHDPKQFEVHCFDTSLRAPDAIATRLRRHVPDWHRVGELDDDALATAIRGTGIDILVDLAGHTQGNRLLTFARKPAPVQVTWLGYLGTTGLTAMDYRLTDAHMDPPGMTEMLHTEELVRLPVQACFQPWPEAPPVEPPPVTHGHPLTFGSVNQWPKVSERAIDLWASILVRRPDARLFVIARGGRNPAMQRMIAGEFAKRGARDGQVEVFSYFPTTEFLRFLGRIDIALDPFPYGGGTTTMQCLWMGVPVITMGGVTPMSRNSIGPLNVAGLPELVASSASDYRDIALALGSNEDKLADLRSGLRQRIGSSALSDAAAFARALEAAYLRMWDRHQSQRPSRGRQR